MSVLENFNKLHVSIKSIALSITSIVPFFFVSIYLFDYKLLLNFKGKTFFINDFDVIFIFALCFILSLTWVISNVFLSIGTSIILDKITDSEPDIEMPFVLTFFYSICYLTLAIVVNYYIFKYSLMKFVFLSHLFLLIRFLYVYFSCLYLKIKLSSQKE